MLAVDVLQPCSTSPGRSNRNASTTLITAFDQRPKAEGLGNVIKEYNENSGASRDPADDSSKKYLYF